jgi:hypothetical protein
MKRNHFKAGSIFTGAGLAAFAAVVVYLLGCAAPVVQIDPSQVPIPNLRMVVMANGEHFWRGGQPTLQGWQWLKGAGVSNVVKLNELPEGSDAQAVALGMTLRRHPVDVLQQLITGPDDADFKQAVSEIKPGTFVHCGSDSRTKVWLTKREDLTSGGNDRTGLAVAELRRKEGWTKEAAYNEALTNGFHPALLGLHHYWEESK